MPSVVVSAQAGRHARKRCLEWVDVRPLYIFPILVELERTGDGIRSELGPLNVRLPPRSLRCCAPNLLSAVPAGHGADGF